MALYKTDQADLHGRYPLYIEIGLIVALLVLIVAFNIEWRGSDEFDIPEREQEIVEIEEIEQTKQIEKPPPPPRPQVPVEVPNDEVLDDATIDLDAELDLNAEPTAPPPPPEPVEEEEEETEPEVFVAVEQMPELIGGIRSLQEQIQYPELARKAGVEGMVVVQFIVDQEGNVTEPTVLRGIGAGCDQEALRVVQQAKFEPGRQRGKPVRVKMSLPIRFSLN
jgi:protein TonB